MPVQMPKKAVKSANDQLREKLATLVDELNLPEVFDGGLDIHVRVNEPATGKTYSVDDYLVVE